jgi:hypothetical protein
MSIKLGSRLQFSMANTIAIFLLRSTLATLVTKSSYAVGDAKAAVSD